MTNKDIKFGTFNIRKRAVPGQPNAQGGFWRQTNFSDADSPEHLF